MYNWNIDEKYFKKHDPEGYEVWRLAQLINYGLDGEKLPLKKLKKLWPKVKEEILNPNTIKLLNRYLINA